MPLSLPIGHGLQPPFYNLAPTKCETAKASSVVPLYNAANITSSQLCRVVPLSPQLLLGMLLAAGLPSSPVGPLARVLSLRGEHCPGLLGIRSQVKSPFLRVIPVQASCKQLFHIDCFYICFHKVHSIVIFLSPASTASIFKYRPDCPFHCCASFS